MVFLSQLPSGSLICILYCILFSNSQHIICEQVLLNVILRRGTCHRWSGIAVVIPHFTLLTWCQNEVDMENYTHIWWEAFCLSWNLPNTQLIDQSAILDNCDVFHSYLGEPLVYPQCASSTWESMVWFVNIHVKLTCGWDWLGMAFTGKMTPQTCLV